MTKYSEVYKHSMENPEAFWGEAAKDIHWDQPWNKVLDDSREPFYRWFQGGKLNTCYNAIDRHIVDGRGKQLALIYDSPVTDTKRTYTYLQLRDEVAKFAGVMLEQGITKGDRVILYMPMVPEAVVAMLACARIGAVHSVVFGGFAPKELATRIDDAKAKMIVTASCGIEIKRVIEYKPLLDQAIEIAQHKPEHCVVLQRPQAKAAMTEGRDVDWHEAMAKASPADCVSLDATDPLYILYTSGTTGIPKGVVRDNGGHAVALKWSMKNIYNVDPGDVFWAASDVGWVVGHSYIVYGPLLHGSTTMIFEGKPVKTPDAGAFWRVIEEYNIKTLFTAPTAFRAIKREDPEGELLKKYDLSHFKALFLAGERCDPDTLLWAQEKLNVPVVDHWWQTETGWPIVANCLGIEQLPIVPGSPTVSVPGYDVQVVDSDGNILPRREIGNIVVKLPLPPGCLPTLWEKDERFVESYLSTFPGYYLTGDAGYMDESGYLYIMSRIDDLINVAGHRLSTGGMEEVLASHEDIAECATIGVNDSLKGEIPLGFVVLKAGVQHEDEDIKKDLVLLMRKKMGAVASFKKVLVVNQLPKTRSGKILRRTMRSIANGEEYKVPATIDDPTVLDEIAGALKTIGYPGNH